MVFAYAPFNLWIIAPLLLVVFFRQWQRLPKRSFLLGWLFGLGWFGTGISWVHVSIAEFGGLPLIASIAMMALLSAYLALYPALALYVCQRYVQTSFWPIGIALLWFVAENIRSWMLTGFPWLSVGYTQLNSPLAGWLPIIGETGVSSLLILICASVALWLKRKQWFAMAAIVLVPVISGYVLNTVSWTKTHKSHNVTMVQGNIQQSLRWQPELDRPIMQKYKDLTHFAKASDIVIWPEAAIPQLEPLAQDFLAILDEQAAENDSAVIAGIINFNYETDEVFNNLIVLGKRSTDSESGHYRYFHNNRYAKHHLLPVGEFVPFESFLRPLAPIFDLPMSSFSRGDMVQDNLAANGANIASAICFEIVFPRQVRKNLHHNTDFILTVSNDAWFGNSHGPAQHLQIAQMRAKEFGIPVARATNNGITAFVDHKGKITSRLPQFETATLSDTVVSTRGSTPYRIFGDWPLWILVFIGGILRGKQYFFKGSVPVNY